MENISLRPKTHPHIYQSIDFALAEDIADGDVTSEALLTSEQQAEGLLLAKASGVIAGLELANIIFHRLDPRISFYPLVADGDSVRSGETLARVTGSALSLLKAERVVLNYVQRMSGIATATARFVDATAGYPCRILDTRKTAPGLRYIDKWAVRIGGADNHRMGLFDMVMLKENHIKAAGGIARAVALAKRHSHHPIEVEVETLAELCEALACDVDRILLDNMSLDDMAGAVRIRDAERPACKLEASGKVNYERLQGIASTGVDYISVGVLTHSVRALDISFLIA